jgi:sugar/nucleoside kinase (ribokinase family)
MKEHDVVALGIAVMDIVAAPVDKMLFEHDKTPVDSIILTPGGDAANQATHLARLGRRVALSCRLGDDALGRMFSVELAASGVDLSHAVVSSQSVMTAAIVLVSEDGQRSILHRRGNNYDFCLSDVDMDVIAGAKALSVGSLYGCPKLEKDGLEQVLIHAKRHGVTTFADMATDKKRQRLDGLKTFLPYIDWFVPSEVDSIHLTDGLGCEDAAQVFLDAGAKNVIIKLGERGAYARCADFTGYIPAFVIDAVDTTGSGDAFCAGLIHSLLNGWRTEEALEFACACGAFSALHMGAATARLSQPVIMDFIRNTNRRMAEL